MQYNKTKRGLELAAAILGIIGSFGTLLLGLFMVLLDPASSKIFELLEQFDIQNIDRTILIVAGIICILVSIAIIILSALLIKSPLDANGNLVKKKGIRIALVVLTIWCNSYVVAGLLIAVLCLKDFVNPQQPQVAQNVQTKTANTVEEKLAQIKSMKEQGLIDEATYKKAVQKVFNDVLKN